MLPRVMFISPRIELRRELFPDPVGPMITARSPFSTSKLMKEIVSFDMAILVRFCLTSATVVRAAVVYNRLNTVRGSKYSSSSSSDSDGIEQTSSSNSDICGSPDLTSSSSFSDSSMYSALNGLSGF